MIINFIKNLFNTKRTYDANIAISYFLQKPVNKNEYLMMDIIINDDICLNEGEKLLFRKKALTHYISSKLEKKEDRL